MRNPAHAGTAGLLAILCLVRAWVRRRPGLFAAFQAVAGLAVVFGLTAWMEAVGRDPAALDSLRLDGLGLGLLVLACVVVRQVVPAETVLGALLRPARVPVDRAALAVLLVGQMGVAIVAIIPGVLEEMLAAGVVPPAAWLPQAGWPGWALAGLLAVVLCVEGRARVTGPVVLGLLVLALTMPLLGAHAFAGERAAATALRWELGICFLACSLLLWLRERLARRVESWGLRLETGNDLAARARRLVVAGTAAPVLALAAAGVVLGFYHLRGPGPEPDSLFGRVGRLYSGVVPLALVCAGLVVHALRERLPGYAFTVGLGGNLVATLVVRHHHPEPGWEQGVPLAWANALAFGAAALLWLAGRRRLYGERGVGVLLRVQVGLGLLAGGGVLAVCAILLIAQPADLPEVIGQAGSLAGWPALAVTFLAAGWYVWIHDGGRPRPAHSCALGCSLGLVLGVLLACTLSRWDHGNWLAYHVLTACWAGTAVATLAAGSRPVRRFADAPGGIFEAVPRLPSGPALAWTVTGGALVLGLALRGMYADPTAPWSTCGALFFVSGLAADLALGRRRDGWAFLAGWPLYLAVSLVLCHVRQPWDWERDGRLLARANLVAAGLVALAWLALRRRLYGQARPRVLRAPLLAVQVVLPLAGTLALLAGPLAALVSNPGTLPARVAEAGGAVSWLALAAAVAPAAWYAAGSLGPARIATRCGLGLLLGVLAACTVARWDGGWLAYRVLTLSWAGVGLAALVAGRLRDGRPAARVPEGSRS